MVKIQRYKFLWKYESFCRMNVPTRVTASFYTRSKMFAYLQEYLLFNSSIQIYINTYVSKLWKKVVLHTSMYMFMHVCLNT